MENKEKSKPDYVIVAKELNKLMGIEPPIDVKLPKEEVIALIKEATEELLLPEDEITPFTENYLENKGYTPSEFDPKEYELLIAMGKNVDRELLKREANKSRFKAGDIVRLKRNSNIPTSLWRLQDIDLEVVGFESTMLVSRPLFLIVDDPDGNPHSLNPEFVDKV